MPGKVEGEIRQETGKYYLVVELSYVVIKIVQFCLRILY